jgi:hypothetical protein
MKRRVLVSMIVAGISLIMTGCAQPSEQETTSGESDERSSAGDSMNDTVSVTKRVESQSGLERSFTVTNGGDISYELTCPDGTRKTASGSVTDDEWMAFKQMVAGFDRKKLEETYECTSRCPQDIPSKHIQMTVDGSTVSTAIEATAGVPTGLKEIIAKISDFEGKIQKPTCG